MEPTTIFLLLAVITVSASSHPLEALDTTTSSTDAQTAPSSSDVSRIPIRHNENRLEITLKMDEQNDKEVIDNDMGKYRSSQNEMLSRKSVKRFLTLPSS